MTERLSAIDLVHEVVMKCDERQAVTEFPVVFRDGEGRIHKVSRVSVEASVEDLDETSSPLWFSREIFVGQRAVAGIQWGVVFTFIIIINNYIIYTIIQRF